MANESIKQAFSRFWTHVVARLNGMVSVEALDASLATKLDVSESVGKFSNESNTGEIFNYYAGNRASGNYSHAEGCNTTAMGTYSHAEGHGDTVLPETITPSSNPADANNAWSQSSFSLAFGEASHVEGWNGLALLKGSHAEGVDSRALGRASHAEGDGTTAAGAVCHAEGSNTVAVGIASHAEGTSTIALNYQHAQGHYNDTSKATAYTNSGTSDGTAFVIGNGTAGTTSNAFRVTGLGQVIGKMAYAATGADYAEFFEWADQNQNGEDRVGYFVTFDNGRYIRKAEAGDYILGVVSGNPCVLGNHDECWMGQYEMDEWGRFIYEDIEEVNEETGETKKYSFYKVNPDYDKDMEYARRQDRSEWDAVGLMGVLSVRDDGTCEVNGYCKCGSNGIATASERGFDTYRVIERVNDNIVKVVLK